MNPHGVYFEVVEIFGPVFTFTTRPGTILCTIYFVSFCLPFPPLLLDQEVWVVELHVSEHAGEGLLLHVADGAEVGGVRPGEMFHLQLSVGTRVFSSQVTVNFLLLT